MTPERESPHSVAVPHPETGHVIADVNPEARAVDEQVDRSMARDRTKRDLTDCLESPGRSRVVGMEIRHHATIVKTS